MDNLSADGAEKRETGLRRIFVSNIGLFCKERFVQARHYWAYPDKHKTALAITSAICIGITPLFGFTLVLVTAFGLIFRLNQVIMQGVHLMVSPLQVLLFFPFMQGGKWMFGLEDTIGFNFKNLPDYIYNHPGEFMHQYLRVFLAGSAIWVIVSIVSGFCIYRFIRWRLGRN